MYCVSEKYGNSNIEHIYISEEGNKSMIKHVDTTFSLPHMIFEISKIRIFMSGFIYSKIFFFEKIRTQTLENFLNMFPSVNIFQEPTKQVYKV